ncbi:MAG: cobalamin-dependent protein [Candidatus Omnitrophica bacterium]|nr:cobalamin-dependent protein [Candidatus Omnitrophota bacterium]MDD5771635.1 cobalamin-dependent protein [Candidatus Omnitrophota bacterium]
MNQAKNKRILLIVSRTSPVPHSLFPPAGIFYIAAVLEKEGFCVQAVDCNKENNFEKKIISLLPGVSLVGITANVATMRNAADISRLVRKHSPEATIVMGGPHPTNIYDKLIPQFADIVVIGEGEYSMRRIAWGNELAEIENIAYWDNGLKVNKRSSFAENLDEFPFPAWHLIDIKNYALKTIFHRIPKAIMLTSRGCPNNCAYCTKTVHGYKIRLRSVRNIMEEIRYLTNRFGVRQIEFWDDNFTFYPQRAKDICSEIIRNGFHKKIKFFCPTVYVPTFMTKKCFP